MGFTREILCNVLCNVRKTAASCLPNSTDIHPHHSILVYRLQYIRQPNVCDNTCDGIKAKLTHG